MSQLNDLLYKLNKYETLLNNDIDDTNKDLYKKKILSYTKKINNLQNIQVGGLTREQETFLGSIESKIKIIELKDLNRIKEHLESKHKHIEEQLFAIKNYIISSTRPK